MGEEVDAPTEIDEEDIPEEMEDATSLDVQHELMDVLALPIRAKPLFHNNHEEIEEFPLAESKDGLTSTSIVVGDGLFRVVKTTLHQDGVPRIDVQLVMDSELTSFQHTIDKPTPLEFGLTGGFTVVGLLLMMIQGLTFIFLGLGLFLVGLKFLPTHLERHRLIFSSCGNSHEISLGTWGLFTPGFRASMALIGPSMADYMRTGYLDVAEINQLHKQLRAPIIPKTLEQPIPQLPTTTTPTEIIPIQTTEVPVEIVGEETQHIVPQAPDQGVPQPVGPPVSIPAPPEPAPAPLPPPIAPPLGPPSIPSPPMMNPSPPAPLPPPLAPLPAELPGMNQPIPLDMPMPEAPRIVVQGTPSDEPLISKEEQDALLDELS